MEKLGLKVAGTVKSWVLEVCELLPRLHHIVIFVKRAFVFFYVIRRVHTKQFVELLPKISNIANDHLPCFPTT
jgi:hypothetical protein